MLGHDGDLQQEVLVGVAARLLLCCAVNVKVGLLIQSQTVILSKYIVKMNKYTVPFIIRKSSAMK